MTPSAYYWTFFAGIDIPCFENMEYLVLEEKMSSSKLPMTSNDPF